MVGRRTAFLNGDIFGDYKGRDEIKFFGYFGDPCKECSERNWRGIGRARKTLNTRGSLCVNITVNIILMISYIDFNYD
jgi:endo-beta-N-acetylglucosaminidase D